MCIYQLGRLRRLILFMDYPPMYIYCPSPTIDIFSLRQPSDNSHFRQPSEPFPLDSSHALTPIVLGCPSACKMHDANSITVYNTCKYINMHILI